MTSLCNIPQRSRNKRYDLGLLVVLPLIVIEAAIISDMVFRSERQEEVIVKPYQSLECHAARDRMHLSHNAIIKAAVPPAKRLKRLESETR